MLGGSAAAWIGMPLPFMLGAMIAVTIAAVSHAPMKAPVELRMIVVPIIGVMLGSGFKPDTFSRMDEWALTFAILPLFIAFAFSGAVFFYRWVGKYDPVTAYFASAPGGVTEMFLLGEAAGGDGRRIALAHASRILVVVSFIALFYGFVLDISATGNARPYVTFAAVPPQDLMILAACAIVGTVIARKVKMPAAPILGPMLCSAAAHIAGLTDVPPPSFLVNSAQVVMGTVIGCRFLGSGLREIGRDLLLALGACTVMLLVALGTALAITTLTGIALKETFLTFSPGGLPEMSLLALAMDADVAYIATMHITRIALVIATIPFVFKLLKIEPR